MKGIIYNFAIRSSVAYLLTMIGFTQALAQDFSMRYNVNAGIALPILDNGIGLHIGANPYFLLGQRFAIEGQFSYARINVSSGFISGSKSVENQVNGLAGIRLYFHKSDRLNRLFINFLAGAHYSHVIFESGNEDKGWEPGFSYGLYYKFGKNSIGMALESTSHLAIKFGREF